MFKSSEASQGKASPVVTQDVLPQCPSDAPIAIVGMGFRFPGDLGTEDALWGALAGGKDLVSSIPPDRWATSELQHGKRSEPGHSITFAAGVLSRIDEFDADFFGISPREAAWLDPQQRLLLELAWEAMENAGVPPSSMKGSDCAVYVGISSFDYGTRGIDDLASMTSHLMTGNTLSIAANRLSYIFDLRGPSLAVDTACSSSLVALHHACNSLRNGEASSALVGGVNLLLHPHPFVGFTKASMLSADGRCKSFDASGDGYVRAEGGAVLLLKPLDKALADGDDIQAVIRASGVNADGARKTGITIPSSEGQAELMRSVLARSGLSAHDVDFIEAHGTGTVVGDPIEASAIGQVYGCGRSTALPIGSVKANIGHLEPASGMAGLIKAVLAIKNRALPPALHLATPNPHIDFAGLNLQLVTKYQALSKAVGKPLVAGVNSFGFGGANAHVLLQEFVLPVSNSSVPEAMRAPPLFLSARSDAALRAMAGRYADLDISASNYYDIAHAAAHQRERMENRLVLQPDTAATTADLLRQYADGGMPAQIFVEDGLPQSGDVAFVYSGNGAQWVGMGRTLLSESARFAGILADLDARMQPVVNFSLIDELQAADGDARLDDTSVAQPLLFAIQVVITTMLREAGIQPAAVTGHSVGEIAAAWASGALDLEQAIRVISARSQSQNLTRGTGRMAAIGLSACAIKDMISELGDGVDVELAGINSPGNVTISGSLDGLLRIQALLEPRNVFFRLLDLDYAFHSRQMDSIEADLAERLEGLVPVQSTNATFVSTVTGDVLDGSALEADYWWRNVRQPVRFSAAIVKLAEQGCRVFIEIGPHAILQRYVNECLAGARIKGRVLPTLRRHDDGLSCIEEAALRAHLHLDRSTLHAYFPHKARRVRLPNYPWQKERHWHPRTSESSLSIERRRVHPLLGWRLSSADASWENQLDPSIVAWLADHKVGGAIVYPGSAYAEMALAAAGEWHGGEHVIIEELDILAPMVFDDEHGRSLRFILNPRDGGFQIKSRQRLSNDEWTLHAGGRVLASANRVPTSCIPSPKGQLQVVDGDRHYRLASSLGLDYGATFQGLCQARMSADVLEADIKSPETASLMAEKYALHPALFDVCFQSLVDFFAEDIDAGQGIALLPIKIGKLDLIRRGEVVRFRARLRRRSARSVLADFELLDDKNCLIASVTGCRFRAAPLSRQAQSKISTWQITPWLRPHPVDGMVTELPAISSLAKQVRTRLEPIDAERQAWFKETLPLIEALTLAFAYEAIQKLADQRPEDWQGLLAAPYARWLTALLGSEGLLRQENGHWALVSDAELPSSDMLWQTVLRDSPANLPQLALLGRVGRQLPALLAGEIDGIGLLGELQHSPIAEVLYNADPAYHGLYLATEDILRHLASVQPTSRRLRVLEIAAGASDLPKALVDTMPEDAFDYVLALPDDAMQARQQTEYQHHANIVVTTFDTSSEELLVGLAVSGAFDVVILRHTLHSVHSPDVLLAQSRDRLAQGGVLVVAERHADWSADLLAGISPAWWHENEENTQLPQSSLLPAQAWHQALIEEGYIDCQVVAEPAAEDIVAGAYLVLAKRPVDNTLALSATPAATWLLLVDDASQSLAERLCARLAAQGQHVTVSRQLSAQHTYDHVVCMLGWQDTVEKVTHALTRLLEDVQTLSGRPESVTRLWLMTRGGALHAGSSISHQPNPAQAAVWGFGRVVMNEYPSLVPTLIDLACDADDAHNAIRLENELLRPDGANEIVLAREGRHCLMMAEQTSGSVSATEQASERFRLDFHTPGQLRNIVWLPDTERVLQEDEIEVRTQATGLNFRDVMYVMGLLPDEAVENGFAGASLGLEFSGVVSRVGAQVQDLHPGDRVMGFGGSCFASHVVTRADAVALMPEGWTFESAATVPTVFFTVYYALTKLADLQPGERVLIHGAAGGVGLAAIQLARHLGAEVYATAGTDEKRDFVSLLGADHVYDSRSLAFADDILAATAGEGVDVVLNSLAGEAMRRSIDVLKPFGRFLELGKRDFFENTPIGLRPFKSNISYFGIDADQLLTGRPKLAARLFGDVMALFRKGILAPLPYRTFSADHVLDAFRSMQQARHIGKIVVSFDQATPDLERLVQPQTPIQFDQDTTWVVTGGLSGFGLESARWLAARGVGNLVLIGRRGPDTPGAREAIEGLAAQGVNVQALACDVTDAKAVGALIERVKATMPPLKGVLHAAAAFDDRLIVNLDVLAMQTVVNAKLLGAWHLHQATLDTPLEYFVLYSSITTAIGNPGQANYVAANAGLESLAALRRRLGLAAVCIAWGPIADAGYLVRNEAVKDSLEQRLGKAPISAKQALAQLDLALCDETGIFTLANFDWATLARLLPSAASTRFDILNRSRKEATGDADSSNIRALIDGKSSEEIMHLVRDLVIQEVAQNLCISPERIEPSRSLHELGMDSLMAVELALGLEQRFDVQLPVMMLNDAPTADGIAARIVERLQGDGNMADVAPEVLMNEVLRQHGGGLTPEEMDAVNTEASLVV